MTLCQCGDHPWTGVDLGNLSGLRPRQAYHVKDTMRIAVLTSAQIGHILDNKFDKQTEFTSWAGSVRGVAQYGDRVAARDSLAVKVGRALALNLEEAIRIIIEVADLGIIPLKLISE